MKRIPTVVATLGVSLLGWVPPGASQPSQSAEAEVPRARVVLQGFSCESQIGNGPKKPLRPGDRFKAKAPPALSCTAQVVTVVPRGAEPPRNWTLALELGPTGAAPRVVSDPVPINPSAPARTRLTIAASADEVRRAVPMAGQYTVGLSAGGDETDRARTRRSIPIHFTAPGDEPPAPPPPSPAPPKPPRPVPPRPVAR